MKKVNTLKILAGLAAIILIMGILFITNAFVGNPISQMLATRSIKKYVDKNYSSLDLKVDKAVYNFKDSAYSARAKSQTSVDTHFLVYYRDGKVQRDDYESYVLSGFNTIQRFQEEYSSIAKSLISKELGFEGNTTMVSYEKEEYEKANEILKLDAKFEKDIPMKAEVFLRFNLKDSSMENIARIFKDAHKIFLENGCKFNKYNLYGESGESYIMINEVTPAHIESGELESLLEKARDTETEDGIRVFIKGEKK